jgi:hypothetical protein
MKLDRPLDFQAVADHAMYLGMLPAMLDPDSPAYRHPEAARLRAARTPEEREASRSRSIPTSRARPVRGSISTRGWFATHGLR